MSKITFYKCVPHHWNKEQSWLMCTREITTTSYGKEFVRYLVIKRAYKTYSEDDWKFNFSLTGCDYTPNELSLIEILD